MPTAIEIFEYHRKQHCGECTHPTRRAFAMAVANNKAQVERCP
jgi:CO dehydrogenase/acetyl-CoA synthase gamma subunit (corrinoid Fe-S protein)